MPAGKARLLSLLRPVGIEHRPSDQLRVDTVSCSKFATCRPSSSPICAVQFDLTGPGEVWIDDVELREFDDQEIREMKKMITVASYTLESRQLGDCLRLLEGYWPRFLVGNVPLTSEPLAARPRYAPKRSEPSAPADAETKPGIMERMRRAMPSMLR